MLAIPYSKNIGGKKLRQITVIRQVFIANFRYFHNIPYSNGLQFTEGFSAKLPTVLIHQSFLLYSIIKINTTIYQHMRLGLRKSGMSAQNTHIGKIVLFLVSAHDIHAL